MHTCVSHNARVSGWYKMVEWNGRNAVYAYPLERIFRSEVLRSCGSAIIGIHSFPGDVSRLITTSHPMSS